jgi:hypothetical protein
MPGIITSNPVKLNRSATVFLKIAQGWSGCSAAGTSRRLVPIKGVLGSYMEPGLWAILIKFHLLKPLPDGGFACLGRFKDAHYPLRMNTVERRQAKFSIPSIIAIVAAVLSFATGAFLGFVLAMVAIVFGVLGVLLSLSPNIRGGMVSTLSLAAGALGLIAAMIKAVLWLV